MAKEHDLGPLAGEGGESSGQSFQGFAALKGCGGILPGCGLCRSSLAFPHSGHVSANVAGNPSHDALQPSTWTAWLGLPGGDPSPLDHIVCFLFANKAGS